MVLRLPKPVEPEELFDLDELCEPGVVEFDAAITAAAKALKPNRPMRISTWAESGAIRLPSKTSTRAGQLKLYKYQRGILDAQQEPGAEIIALMGVPRIGKTTLFAVGVAYYTAYEGDDVIFYERTKDTLQVFHDSVLWQIMEVSPAFEDLVRKTDDGGPKDKWFDRQLTNGATVRLRSASEPGSFRQIRGRRAFGSEVGDPAWLPSASDGDKIDAMVKRTQNYPDGLTFLESSPTDEELCTVTAYWKKSDMRKFMCACPTCGSIQELVPRVGEKEGPGLKYSVDADNGRVIEAWYECVDGCRIDETDKLKLIESGDWESTPNPNAVPGIIGFHLWAIHSFDKKSSWPVIAKMHLEQLHDPAKRQTFKNLWLGLPWQKADMGAITIGEMEQRAEAYADEVPDPVVILTLGGDNQKGTERDVEAGGKAQRHEIQVVGWGYGEESWVIDHIIIEGDLYSAEAKAQQLELMNREYRKRDGTRMKIAGGCIDANYLMNETLDFVYSPDVKRMRHMSHGANLFAVVGKNEAKGSRTKFATLKRTASHKAMVYYPLATQAAKDTLERRKKITSGPEAIHWPQSLLETIDTPYNWFKSFAAIVRKRTKDGKTYWEDRPGNEAVDCWIYAYGALQLLKEKYSDIRQALARPTEMPDRYDGRDRSYRAQLAEGGIQTVDTRPGATDKVRLLDRRGAVSVTVTDRTPASERAAPVRAVDASPRAPVQAAPRQIGRKTLKVTTRRIG